MNRRRFLLAATTTASLITGCSGDGAEDTPTPTALATSRPEVDETVRMKNATFQPSEADIGAGATVKWTNEDRLPHTVTSARFHETATAWSFDEHVSGGKSATHTFEAEGVYEYRCTVHGENLMCGAVLVGGATLDKSLPCEGGTDGGY